MKLISLRLENFRSFEHCELDLQREGLIGVSGPNGAGKSTLLGAINYALFGRGRGSRELKPERDGMPARTKCEVELEFTLDDRSCVVLRGPRKQRLTVDGEVLVTSGQEELTRRVTELLGVGQLNFAMTFYARQRELQALRPGDKRKAEQLETLLGLDRIKDACGRAREAQSDQEKVVRALEAELPSVAEAEARLQQTEEDAKRNTPPVEEARDERELAREARERARTALTEARRAAEEALALEGKAAVAASELAAAVEREQAARDALEAARAAATELATVEPVAARAEELRARERTLELEAQAAAQAESWREQRHAAQRAAVAAADELAAVADPAPRIAVAEAELSSARTELERVTRAVLELAGRQEAVRKAAVDAAQALTDARRAQALDEELSQLAGVREAVEARASRIAELEAEESRLRAELAEEREHYEHVKRDGPEATCPRCKAPYRERYETIVADFETSLREAASREDEIAGELEQLRGEHASDANKLARLATAQAERAGLGDVGVNLEALEAASTAAAEAQREHARESEQLTKERAGHAAAIEALERELAGLREAAHARERITARQREAERDVAHYEKQLAELSQNGYDRDAHEALRSALAEATEAEARCGELRAQTGQIDLLEARVAHGEKVARDARAVHEDLAAAAEKRAADKDAPEAAETAYDEADQAFAEADKAVHEAEQQALAESNAVAQARADLETARRLKGQLDAQREELSLRRVVAQVLDNYRSAVQQEAVPSLEQETAELLRRTTRGRYSDVEITREGDLRISDMGERYDLQRFSGGEQDLANLCMRLALSKMLARRSGIDARFIILDEVFGSQDQDRRRALVEALRELDQEFGQILLVSHFEDFMEHCDLRVTVKSEGGKSTAKTLVA
jgi:exonuclease SbcC